MKFSKLSRLIEENTHSILFSSNRNAMLVVQLGIIPREEKKTFKSLSIEKKAILLSVHHFHSKS